ncbi:hypothetical protein [Mycobacteroides abscessus]|uniref:hypothetical protein n=1 Tax=Mycobacteroides abscessus TaxID=36809 RepID=UPI00210303E3|nr:hypothetical protein [Mycobacteroides abscessus]
MTHASDAMWARGAVAHTVINPPQAPVYQYPPDNNAPGTGGPHGRFPRFLLLLIAGIAILGIGIGGGWALRGTTTPGAIAPSPTEAAPSTAAPGGLSPAQAKQQACNAYQTLGNQWSNAYQQWLAALPKPWSWSDPAVQAATTRFDATATQVAAQLAALIDPKTPNDVASAITDVRLQIVNLAASHGQTSTGAETDAKLDAVDRSMAAANRVCGI